MKAKLIALGLLAACQVYLVGCSSKKLSIGETGVIESKDPVFAAVDRKSFEDFAKASSVNDKVEEVHLVTYGQVFTLAPGTKVQVITSYEYEGYLAYKVKVLGGKYEGAEAFVNSYYVKPAS